MALRIGFDLDGVLADMEQAIVREATTLFGSTPPSPHEGPGAIGDLVPEEMRAGPKRDAVDDAPAPATLAPSPKHRQFLGIAR